MPQEIAADVQAFLTDRRTLTDQWFFGVRVTLGLGLMGYLAVDLFSSTAQTPVEVVLILGYLMANLGVFLLSPRAFQHARWIYAALDIAFVILLRHLLVFEAVVDPNATMVAFFTLILIAYTTYSDPRLSGSLALIALTAVVATFGLDLAQVALLEPAADAEALVHRSHPLRALLLLMYLNGIGLITYGLAFRLRSHLLGYSAELQKRVQAATTTAIERARRERLEELNRLKKDFITVLSHELRTPLTPLRSSLEIVRAEMEHDRVNMEMLDMALESAGRLHRLVQDYTHLADLLTRERSEMISRNMRVADLLSVMLGAGPSRFVMSGLDGLAVAADPRLLGGALLALLRRAAMLTPDGVPVTVQGELVENRAVVSIHDPSSYVEHETIRALDDPFLFSSERAYFSPNTGIELTLARHSLRQAGGDLRVESHPGRGTTVYCSLPLAKPNNSWINDLQIRCEMEPFVLRNA